MEQERNDSIIKPFTKGELTCAINSIKLKSAHGPDCLSAVFVKKLPADLCQFILKLFNKIFNLGTFPPSWREFFVIFISKVGSDKLRPISLANTFLKFLRK